MARHNHTTVFIAGAGHSGSTLLGMVLGSRDDAFYAGEAAKTRFLGQDSAPLRKRSCKLCGLDCPVWSTLTLQPEPDLHEQLSRHTGRPVVIDSAKGLDWLHRSLGAVRAHGGRPVLLFLTRDGRAVINSRVRKYPDRDPATEIERWLGAVRGTRDLFSAFDGPKTRLRYEHLATRPKATVQHVCEVAGLDYRPSMLQFQRWEHHVLGGNDGTQYQVARAHGLPKPPPPQSHDFYTHHPSGIRLDRRWHDELSPSVRALFDRMAGPTNRSLL